jgi:hypothetical protein
MKKSPVILTLLALFVFGMVEINAQKGPNFFSLHAGTSVPFGSFSSYDLQEGSFAITGITAGADGAWYFLPYLGIGGECSFNFQPINVGVLGYEEMLNNPSIEELTIRSEAFQTISVAAGIYGDWNFWKSFSLTGKLLGGWIWAKTPYQLYKPVYFMVGTNWFEITSSKDNGFILVPGIGLQYNISHCIGVKAESELYYRKMTFGFSNYEGIYYEHKTVSFVNISLGLVVFL